MRHNLNETEILEWSILSTLLQPPSRPMVDDTWKWNLDTSGQFNTRSLSQYLASNGNIQNAALYKNIWKGPIPKNVRFFLWEVSYGNINTANTLIRKAPWIVSGPSCCAPCHRSRESLVHIFVLCEYIQSFLEQILDFFQLSYEFLKQSSHLSEYASYRSSS